MVIEGEEERSKVEVVGGGARESRDLDIAEGGGM